MKYLQTMKKLTTNHVRRNKDIRKSKTDADFKKLYKNIQQKNI